MPTTTIHGIYTEGKNEPEVVRLAWGRFDSFTVHPTAGYLPGRMGTVSRA
jgi:hypothetical protein